MIKRGALFPMIFVLLTIIEASLSDKEEQGEFIYNKKIVGTWFFFRRHMSDKRISTGANAREKLVFFCNVIDVNSQNTM